MVFISHHHYCTSQTEASQDHPGAPKHCVEPSGPTEEGPMPKQVYAIKDKCMHNASSFDFDHLRELQIQLKLFEGLDQNSP